MSRNSFARAGCALLTTLTFGAAAEGFPGGACAVGFVPNHGQWPAEVRFLAPGGEVPALIEDNGFTLGTRVPGKRRWRLPPAALVGARFVFEGADPHPVVTGDRAQRARYHFLLGADPSRWRRDVRAWSRVLLRDLYPGVTVVLTRGAQGALRYDLLLEPGADLERVVVRCEGSEGLALEPDGAMRIETAHAGVLRQAAPVAWYDGPGGDRERVECRIRILGADRFGFVAPARDADRPLVIDPTVRWARFLGGEDEESAWDVAHDEATGTVVVAGSTTSFAFPFQSLACRPLPPDHNGTFDAFVSRLDARTGALLSSTIIGGEGSDEAIALALTSAGITIAGYTSSAGFPATEARLGEGGALDGFVLELDARACELRFASVFGGAGDESATALALAADGTAGVAGFTSARDFPVSGGAFQTAYGGGAYDAFFVALAPPAPEPAPRGRYATYLGGSGSEAFDEDETDLLTRLFGGALVAERGAAGTFLIGGRTGSPDFPTTAGAPRRAPRGRGHDATLTRLRADAAAAPAEQLRFSTLIGGSDGDAVQAMALAADGTAWLLGMSASRDFPVTAGALQGTYGGGVQDVFFLRYDPSRPGAEQVRYASFLGGAGNDFAARTLAVSASGVLTLAGQTGGQGFPTTPNGARTTFSAEGVDGFLVRVLPDAELRAAEQLRYGTFLGGGGASTVSALAVGSSDASVVVAGATFSTTLEGADEALRVGEGLEVFVTRLDLDGPFERGDASADGARGIEDATTLLGHLFLGAPGALLCEKSADWDDSGALDVADAVALLGFLFLGGPAPAPPSLACGEDPTPDRLECVSFPACDV